MATSVGKVALQIANKFRLHTGEYPYRYTFGDKDCYVTMQAVTIKTALNESGLKLSEMEDYLKWYFTKRFAADGEPWAAGQVLSKRNVEQYRQFLRAHAHEPLEVALNRPTTSQATEAQKAQLRARGRRMRATV